MESSQPSRTCAKSSSLMPFPETLPARFCAASSKTWNGNVWAYRKQFIQYSNNRRCVHMDTKNLVAIDVHTHAHISERIPDDPLWQEIQEAASGYFKKEGSEPTISEVAAYYRERKMACVIFPVNMESSTGLVRVPNEEVAGVGVEKDEGLI